MASFVSEESKDAVITMLVAMNASLIASSTAIKAALTSALAKRDKEVEGLKAKLKVEARLREANAPKTPRWSRIG